MRTDGRTDMTKLTVAFRNFVNAPEKNSCPHWEPNPPSPTAMLVITLSVIPRLQILAVNNVLPSTPVMQDGRHQRF